MSMDRCVKCSRAVDTDEDLDCYVGVGEIPVDSTGPALTCATVDAPAAGATLTIEGSQYAVRSIQPDGTGITLLRLEAL